MEQIVIPLYKTRALHVFRGYFMRSKPPTERIRKIKSGSEKVGQRFGQLLVLEDLGTYKGGEVCLGCVCDCGVKIAVKSRGLREGILVSCGCKNRGQLLDMGGKNKKAVGQSAFNQLLLNYRRSAKLRNYDFALSEEEFRELTSSACFYCGSLPFRNAPRAKKTNGDYVYNGIDRIDNSLGYFKSNVRTCCKNCNVAKASLSQAEFYKLVCDLYNNLKSKGEI
jgi:hypothetical protein